MLQSIVQSIQLALRNYQCGSIRRSINQFRESAVTLLYSRMGRLALQAAQETGGTNLSYQERRHMATARLFVMIRDADVEAEDWIVKALVELALRELEMPAPASAMQCFHL